MNGRACGPMTFSLSPIQFSSRLQALRVVLMTIRRAFLFALKRVEIGLVAICGLVLSLLIVPSIGNV